MPEAASTRTLHLIDIENLIGSPLPARSEVAACRQAYGEIVAAGDHVVVACNHRAFLTVGWEWPGVRHLLRSGTDGADLALLDVLDHERVAARFGSVVIGSGDGIFTESVARLGGRGVDVTVVSRRDALARRLRLAARRVLYVVEAPQPLVAGLRLSESA